jgi:hypothetical protein
MNSNLFVIVIASAIFYGTPLFYAALGGIFTERSGVLNLGVEGTMLLGGVSGAWASHHVGGSAWFTVLMSIVIGRAKKDPKRVVFGEADNLKILKAAQLIRDEKIAIPILLGNRERILELIEENSLDLDGVTIIDPMEERKMNEKFGKILAQRDSVKA